MTDEATTYFPSTVDNIIEGQQFVYNELSIKFHFFFFLVKLFWSHFSFKHFFNSLICLFQKKKRKVEK